MPRRWIMRCGWWSIPTCLTGTTSTRLCNGATPAPRPPRQPRSGRPRRAGGRVPRDHRRHRQGRRDRPSRRPRRAGCDGEDRHRHPGAGRQAQRARLHLYPQPAQHRAWPAQAASPSGAPSADYRPQLPLALTHNAQRIGGSRLPARPDSRFASGPLPFRYPHLMVRRSTPGGVGLHARRQTGAATIRSGFERLGGERAGVAGLKLKVPIS